METTSLKSVLESKSAQKSVEVRLIKAAKLIQELSLIKQKDQQARNLARVQAKLQERVRLTHELQQ
jgi:low affinity Fe/Cu permease